MNLLCYRFVLHFEIGSALSVYNVCRVAAKTFALSIVTLSNK